MAGIVCVNNVQTDGLKWHNASSFGSTMNGNKAVMCVNVHGIRVPVPYD